MPGEARPGGGSRVEDGVEIGIEASGRFPEGPDGKWPARIPAPSPSTRHLDTTKNIEAVPAKWNGLNMSNFIGRMRLLGITS